ncbi:efflux RND transporter periplasmic adaptor subunit [Tunicatimonas pelagia]|uniref:efflux RND transporter periplasmic adaptor subunit n=1 Tax=Tunicatimonas pelagia TaxID=931531 RepID=UPI002664EFCA|nr:efflux RND transporter periplasmic adaptor subunit [Tunicatimonas pelagia]WKN43087.1 efflux RND transporter periplasmic adaptor subunit [Tunicatimonas pelagia]
MPTTARTKKKKRNPILIIAIVVGTLLVLLLIARQLEWIGGEKAVEVRFASVEPHTIIERVSASGTIQPVTEVKISPEVPGEIIELNVEEGDSVQQDQLLVRIRPDNFESILSRTQANLNQQRAALAQMQAQAASAEAQLERARLAFERNQKLYDDQVISDADFEQFQSDFQVAQQSYESARQNVEAARYAVRSSEASVEEARENLSLTSIYAPMAGIVSKLDVEQGERVVGTSQMAGTEMLRIADLSKMEVRVDVNENDIIRVALGDTASIEVDAYSYDNYRFQGVVTSIANTANEKLTNEAVTEFEVRIRLLNSSYQKLLETRGPFPFRPGMTASVDVLTNRKEDVLSVPLSAVTTRNKENKNEPTADAGQDSFGSGETLDEVVFRKVDEERVEKVIVETGISDYEFIEILSGLTTGDEIVSGPYIAISNQLKDSSRVEITQNGGTSND